MISVLGAGAFGTALAVALSAKGPVTLWGRNLPEGRSTPRLPGVIIPEQVRLTDNLDGAIAQTMILALPAQALRGFLAEHGDALNEIGRAHV